MDRERWAIVTAVVPAVRAVRVRRQTLRWAWNAATVGLIAWTIAFAGLWSRSTFVAADSVVVAVGPRRYAVTAVDGRVQVSQRMPRVHREACSADAFDYSGLFDPRTRPEPDATDEAVTRRLTVRHDDWWSGTFRSLAESYLHDSIGPWYRSELEVDAIELTEADTALAYSAAVRRTIGGRPAHPFDDVVTSTVHAHQLQKAAVPLWQLTVLAALLPAGRGLWVVGRRWRRRRTPSGHCVRCGYDLRASPGPCPECGAAGVAV